METLFKRKDCYIITAQFFEENKTVTQKVTVTMK